MTCPGTHQLFIALTTMEKKIGNHYLGHPDHARGADDQHDHRAQARRRRAARREPDGPDAHGRDRPAHGAAAHHHADADHRRREPPGSGRPDPTGRRGDRFFADEGAAAGHLPERVEDAAADIGVIFSFRLEELYAMGIVELMEWRERARERSGAEE
ncbi:hypothetical protein [Ralstonia phage RSY1]|uniref:Uncharacterized protein n=1 Tax=Ralstonia phage RSY1 TaxID=1530085 RepID=A0A077K821_9CAUD|nr:tail protein [Ralstonia phage RSY1]BAP28131.1 hypothetical protein [Ralstonia phage RSY1]